MLLYTYFIIIPQMYKDQRFIMHLINPNIGEIRV